MPLASYKCRRCHKVIEYNTMQVPSSCSEPCKCVGSDGEVPEECQYGGICGGILDWVPHKVSIGKVPGAGNSPAR